METILIVDDNRDMQFVLSKILKEQGYETVTVGDGQRAIKELKTKSPNLVLLDIKLPGIDGMKILEEMKQVDKDVVIIMLTAFGAVKDAVRAMRLGAFDYITKPFDNEEITLIIKKAISTQYLSKEIEVLRRRLGESKTAIENMMGESPRIKQLLSQVNIVAATNMTVILQGESGTGKELISQMIYQKSRRADKPFIAVDCGAIPETLVESELFGYEKGAFTGADERKEGKFEQANGGTLFLDEITNLSDAMQMKFLRVIQERKLQRLGGKKDTQIDTRIIAATNNNLYETVKTGKFRDDLFHRLNEFYINLPPLRERKEDVPILAKYFLDGANQELNKRVRGFSQEAMKFFLDYSWPGNVRELKNLVKRGVLLSDTQEISLEHLSIDYSASCRISTLQNTINLQENFSFSPLDIEEQQQEKTKFLAGLKGITREFERRVVSEALERANGNKNKAAEILQINRKALYRKMKTVNLS